jgi:hypothetical protein
LGSIHAQAVFKSLATEPLGHCLHDPPILTNPGAQLHPLFIQTYPLLQTGRQVPSIALVKPALHKQIFVFGLYI